MAVPFSELTEQVQMEDYIVSVHNTMERMILIFDEATSQSVKT